jgi:four helix bundle protein
LFIFGKREMNSEELKKRTKEFGLRVIDVFNKIPKARTAEFLGRQLIRSATSVGANYRAACLARSRADFVSKIGIVAEEADESAYWLETLLEAKLMDGSSLNELLKEANELTAIFVASIRTARLRV